ncbi:hypothetical protein GH868_30590, partial [Bacillus thuringiensis]|nr:hypothetical protein [Bacillus thuringiensis]
TLNTKTTIYTIKKKLKTLNINLPLIISKTITNTSNHTLSKQTTKTFYNSLHHTKTLSFNLNYTLKPNKLQQYIQKLSHITKYY